MAYIVGLTGGIGSGKSTIAQLFSKLDVPIIDTDIIARQIFENNPYVLDKVVQHFGSHILNTDGSLDRGKLRNRVFNNQSEKKWLNHLLHPIIRQTSLSQLAANKSIYCLWVVPLLIENLLTKYCDRVLVIDVDPMVQLQRASQRDNHNSELIKSIIAAQTDRTTRINAADDVISNQLELTESLDRLTQCVLSLHQKYIGLAENN